jgi:tRNA (adenine37-N6)-methyltransferase
LSRERELVSDSKDQFTFAAIGVLQSPFKDRFAVPRQHGFASAIKGVVKLRSDSNLKMALRDLDQFSHIWLTFVFHAHGKELKGYVPGDVQSWNPTIHPPRFGGEKKVGLLASRSPHRPNPIGISVVKLDRIDFEARGGAELHVSGHDLVDGTPILDIKPYIAAVDVIADANSGWAGEPIKRWAVDLSSEARAVAPDDVLELIVATLEIDPRPPFQQKKSPVDALESEGQQYGFDVGGYDVKYEIRGGGFYVTEVTPV